MRFHENLLILSAAQIEDSDEVDETELSGKQGTTSLGRTEELPRPQRGSPFVCRATSKFEVASLPDSASHKCGLGYLVVALGSDIYVDVARRNPRHEW